MNKRLYYGHITRPPKKMEHMNPRSKTTKVRVIPNSQKIVQSIISGALIESDNIGYDYRNDQDLPENFDQIIDLKKADITEQLDFQKYITGKINDYKDKLTEQEILKKELLAESEGTVVPPEEKKLDNTPE